MYMLTRMVWFLLKVNSLVYCREAATQFAPFDLYFSGIVDKIDSDNDDKVTEPELVAWIKYIQRRYVTEDSKTQWANYDLKKSDTMSWEYYRNRTYGGMSGTAL